MQPTQPGWYWDPKGMPNLFRWWDGETWTDHVSPIRNVGPPVEPTRPAPSEDGRYHSGGLSYAGSGTGWLIFRTGPSELGVHPTRSEHEGRVYENPRQHLISLQCDDVEATKAELEARGAELTSDIADEGYGLVTTVAVPGADGLMLYQPKHELALDA